MSTFARDIPIGNAPPATSVVVRNGSANETSCAGERGNGCTRGPDGPAMRLQARWTVEGGEVAAESRPSQRVASASRLVVRMAEAARS
jgi:hypothetical protein